MRDRALRSRSSTPWTLVAASLLSLAIVLYLLFFAYLPAKRQIVRLEAELRDLYGREAQLQTRLVREAERHAIREQQVSALTAEHGALARRLEELEKELGAAKTRRRR